MRGPRQEGGICGVVYEGHCQRCGLVHSLPRSDASVSAARRVMEALERSPITAEGKMYGVLLACRRDGGVEVLRAFSGRVDGVMELPGWAPPVPQEDTREEEARTFERLEAIRAELSRLRSEDAWAALRRVEEDHEARIKEFDSERQRAKARRKLLRAQGADPGALDLASQREGTDRRRLRAERAAAVAPLRERAEAAMARATALKRERRALSHALQALLHAAYELPNPAGDVRGLHAGFVGAPPSGAGECCAPKLLVWATRRGLRPLGMAEFWWGPPSGDGARQPGTFYGPCEERCQPILGHLLCDGGLAVVYEDAQLLVIDKPAGLPSVPGRTQGAQDSVQSRARRRCADARVAHRLDMDTSGLLVVAKDGDTLRALHAAFASRLVEKRYEAFLEGPPREPEGTLRLRQGPDPDHRPRQKVGAEGKLAITRYAVLEDGRVAFFPETGRTHQLRVAAAYGLGRPIVGDRLYGRPGERLLLHAAALAFEHPTTGARLRFASPPPF